MGKVGIYNDAKELQVQAMCTKSTFTIFSDSAKEEDPNIEILHWIKVMKLHRSAYQIPFTAPPLHLVQVLFTLFCRKIVYLQNNPPPPETTFDFIKKFLEETSQVSVAKEDLSLLDDVLLNCPVHSPFVL